MNPSRFNFRAHVKATGEVLPVVSIDWEVEDEVVVCVGNQFGTKGNLPECHDLADVDLMQSTGLVDADGREVFDDDNLLGVNGSTYVVSGGLHTMLVDQKTFDSFPVDEEWLKTFRVIGTIYDKEPSDDAPAE